MAGSRTQEALRRSARRASGLLRRAPRSDHAAPEADVQTSEPRVPRPETTRPTLSDPDKQADLERYGFAVVDALDEAQLELARQLYAELGPAPDDPKVALNWSFHSRSAAYKREVKAKMLAAFGDVVDEMLVDHEVYLTTFITKWPGPNSGFAPHQDPSLVDERHYRGVTVWIPLGDTGPVDGIDNGMLRFVPGSHRFSDALRVTDVDRSQVAGHEEAVLRHGVGMPSTAGQALVFDNRVIHYSMPNESDEPRVVLSFGVRPREGACTLMRADDEGTVRIYEIDDDFYIDVLPAENHLYEPAAPPIATIEQGDIGWSAEEFERLCSQAPVPPGAIRSEDVATAWRDPGVFCALCGSSEGLGDADRSVRNNAQLVCASCEQHLRDRDAAEVG